MNYLKCEARENIIVQMNNLSKKEREEKSEIIKRKIMTLEEFERAKIIMCYINFKSEVETRAFIKEALLMGKRIVTPLILDERTMVASEVRNIDNDVKIGLLGIYESKNEHIRSIKSKEIDLAIIPGIVFDIEKNRIGHGKGYYDRFLARVRTDCVKIGIGFDIQILESIPCEFHDVPMDKIITENRTI